MRDDNLREPNFDNEMDMFVLAHNETKEQDRLDGLELKANVLIFSYNRPKLLREAIDSVLAQDYRNFDLYIVDDGSDNFDPEDLQKEYDDSRIVVAQAPQITMEERLKRSRLGANANSVIEQIPDEEPIYYLCDDDLMGRFWLSRSIRAFQATPETHMIQGESWYFNDGDDPWTQAKYGMPIDGYQAVPTMFWSTGSFAHRALCSKQEGIWWTDNTLLHSQDTNFIMDFWVTHPTYAVVQAPAVYRREHEHTLSAKLGRKNDQGKYEVGFRPGAVTKEMLNDLDN
jgi:cellulose synthase/poly-beta-1,6-N-acetylglucosamine synthase-like glycosyltransferase